MKKDLYLSNKDLALRRNQVVIPASLREKVFRIAHGDHLGIVKAKQLLRSNLWFPGIDGEVERLIKRCQKCQINTESTKFEPIGSTEMPEGPWDLVSIDFYGPVRCGKYLLVIICEYSRYPIVKILSSVSGTVVIPTLNEIFSMFGIPPYVKSDNGPPFNSHQFAQFADEQGFKHHCGREQTGCASDS